MSGKAGVGAIAFAGLLVAGYAVWRKLKDGEQEPQFVIIPAKADGDDGQNFWQAAASNGAFDGLINWGVDTIFGALGGSKGTGGASGEWTEVSGGGRYSYDTAPTSGLSSLLGVIGLAEAPQGYNQVYSGIKGADRPPRPLTQMTVGEVLDWQDSIDSRYNSEAAGRYQIMEDTLRDQVRKGVVSKNDMFNAATQDRLAESLMQRRGLDQYRSGAISAETFANNLSQEWAGLPVATGSKAGQSYYDGYNGNSARTTVESVLSAIRGIL